MSRESAPSAFRIADAHEVDIALAVDLATGQEEHVDAALPGAVEQLAPAIGEEVVLAALQQRDVGHAATALAREQRGDGGDRRGIADGDMADVADQAGDDVGEQLLVAKGRSR
jgi:hypothetical protein